MTFPAQNSLATLEFFPVKSPFTRLVRPFVIWPPASQPPAPAALRPQFDQPCSVRAAHHALPNCGSLYRRLLTLEHHPSTHHLPSSIQHSFGASVQELLLLGSLLRHSMSLRGAPSNVSDSPVRQLSCTAVWVCLSLCLFYTPSALQSQGPIPSSFSGASRNVLQWLSRPEMARIRALSTSRMQLEILGENFQKTTQKVRSSRGWRWSSRGWPNQVRPCCEISAVTGRARSSSSLPYLPLPGCHRSALTRSSLYRAAHFAKKK